jgi:hypothetical protein
MLLSIRKQKYTLAKICVKSSTAITHRFFVCIISPKGNMGTHARGSQRNFLEENLRGSQALGTQSLCTHSASPVWGIA